MSKSLDDFINSATGSVYRPDSWIPVRVDSVQYGTFYKILASWYGGYANSDWWKLSSGVEAIDIIEDTLVMPQTSGSLYICSGPCHVSSLIGNVLHSYQAELAAAGRGTLTQVSKDELLEAFK